MNSQLVAQTLVTSGGLAGCLNFILLWSTSGEIALSEVGYLASVTAGSSLALISGFLPRVGCRLRASVGLYGGILILLGVLYMVSCCASTPLFRYSYFSVVPAALVIMIGSTIAITKRTGR